MSWRENTILSLLKGDANSGQQTLVCSLSAPSNRSQLLHCWPPATSIWQWSWFPLSSLLLADCFVQHLAQPLNTLHRKKISGYKSYTTPTQSIGSWLQKVFSSRNWVYMIVCNFTPILESILWIALENYLLKANRSSQNFAINKMMISAVACFPLLFPLP